MFFYVPASTQQKTIVYPTPKSMSHVPLPPLPLGSNAPCRSWINTSISQPTGFGLQDRSPRRSARLAPLETSHFHPALESTGLPKPTMAEVLRAKKTQRINVSAHHYINNNGLRVYSQTVVFGFDPRQHEEVGMHNCSRYWAKYILVNVIDIYIYKIANFSLILKRLRYG